MVQVPVETKVSAPPEVIVQTPVVLDVRLTVSPDVAVAVNVGVVPKFWPPGLAMTVQPVIVIPPLEAGALKLTVACALPAVAVPMVGAPGTVAGVTLQVEPERLPVPIALVAVTVKE